MDKENPRLPLGEPDGTEPPARPSFGEQQDPSGPIEVDAGSPQDEGDPNDDVALE